MEQKFGYNDIVAYSPSRVAAGQKPFKVAALVLQSHVIHVEDVNDPTGFREEEDLVLVYLDPLAGKSIMTGADTEKAIRVVHGAKPMNYNGNTGVGYEGVDLKFENMLLPKALSVPLNPHPEEVQYSPEHMPQHPIIGEHGGLNAPEAAGYQKSQGQADGSEGLSSRNSDTAEVHPEDQPIQAIHEGAEGTRPQDQPVATPETPEHEKEERDKEEWLRKEQEAKEHREEPAPAA